MAFEHYIRSGSKLLRCGYTTGTCAALASMGAAERLLAGRWPQTVALVTPADVRVEVELEELSCTSDDTATCAVRKDAGDDVDATANALVFATVQLTPQPGIVIDGGQGVGRVTKPGLDQPVGAAAINHVPRRMIGDAVSEVAHLHGYDGGFAVTIWVPEGTTIAAKTFNPNLGIEGGISILGTSGIVKPMSIEALVASIALEIRQVAALGNRDMILTPGNYGADFLASSGLEQLGVPIVRYSNFIGDALDEAAAQGFEKILVVSHIGKFSKLAGGIMNTHSRYADCRVELFCTHAALCGASQQTVQQLYDAATTDACIEVLDGMGLRQPVLRSMLDAAQRHLEHRIGDACKIGAVTFSNVYGKLGTTQTAEEILASWNK